MEYSDSPRTLSNDGEVPSTRMEEAREVCARVARFIDADAPRAQRRTIVKGLVDGNPPYRDTDLRNAGRAHQCNVNWRIGEKYLNQARSAFYDIFSETPTYATVTMDYGPVEVRNEWGGIIGEEFDWLLRQDKAWDYNVQISQYDMILYGVGPLMFQDETDWRNVAVLCRDFLVAELSKSDPSEWEECAVLKDYFPHELYSRIRNESQAKEMGWNVEAVKQAIIDAHPKTQEGGQYKTWEYHQQLLKNASYQYSAESRVIPCAHYLFREFPNANEDVGGITHCTVVNPQSTNAQEEFLFRKERQFKSWLQFIHPMYYDNDGGGYHHSVTGLGVKMYSAMAFQNKLICNIADKVFAPKVLFKPTTAAAAEQWNMVVWGDYGRIPPGFDMLQVPVGSFAEDGLVVNREMTGLIANNLAQYQANLSREGGNPITATEAQYRASEQARIGKTQLNHYYNQMDRLYQEKYNRAIKCPAGMPGGKLAAEFRDRCKARGVPVESLKRCTVKATRIVGQGSQFMRQQSLSQMMALAPSLNEEGRNNLISDFIASHAGQAMVERYNPPIEMGGQPADQQVVANLQVGAAKSGVPPVVAPNQNAGTFATTFVVAASQAVQSVEQGADPSEVLNFLSAIAPATEQHLQRLAVDPMRQGAAELLTQQWQQVKQAASQLEAMVQQQQQQQMEAAQAQQQAQAIQAGVDPNIQIKAAETQAKIAMQQQKTNAMLDMKRQKHMQDMSTRNQSHNQDLALKDASTAASITLQSAKSKSSQRTE